MQQRVPHGIRDKQRQMMAECRNIQSVGKLADRMAWAVRLLTL
jgi:hypothetical protein